MDKLRSFDDEPSCVSKTKRSFDFLQELDHLSTCNGCFFHRTGRTELSSTKAWGQCSAVIVRILSRSGPKGPSQTNPDKDNIDEPHSEPLTAKAVCKNSEGLSVTNESTLEKAYEKCKQLNSTFCE